MHRNLTEKQVLKKLDIPDFRHMTKDKVINFMSMIPNMDSEVAKKALEQFPEFAKISKDILTGYEGILNEGIKSNNESVMKYYDACNIIIESLRQELNREEYSFEEKKQIMDRMMQVANMIGEKDKENKKFIVTMSAFGGIAVSIVIAALSSALGSNAKIESIDNDMEN